MMNRKIITTVLAAVLVAAVSCRNEQKENLARAQRTFDRLDLGMNKLDTCWYFGVTCADDSPDLNYQKDFGTSFSKQEVQVTIWVRADELVRVEIVRPYYNWRGVRISGQGKESLVAEKGLAENEIK